jgi:polar amino acid transport system permease protein/polar amino acid transport system substrate-binding protein
MVILMKTLPELLYDIFVEGGAYLTILKGIGVTLEITILSVIFGTILAFGICRLRISKNRFVSTLAALYIAILRGSPVLLVLMIFYYVIFATSPLSAPMIAVFAYSTNFSAHVAEIMRTSFQATDKMQSEAARTLGFSKWQAFFYITFPQAVDVALPVYQSAIVTLLQWTSVVGYVTITDLTKVINNITMRTMQPMIMLITGVLLYLAIAYIVYGIFAFVEKRRMAGRGGEH